MAAQPPDWSAGRYETTAAELAPAADRLVELAAPQAGERVLDLGTGTGNAALAAARRDARATGVDSARRLLEVARERARVEGLQVEFVEGDLLKPPVAAGAFDLALSAFGVIFARDPGAAMAAIARALAPGGRALLTAWVPEGPIHEMLAVLRQASAQAGFAPPAGFPWHDPEAVGELAAPYGARAGVQEERLAIRSGSPREYFETGERDHPLSIAGRSLLEQAGTYEDTRAAAIAVLERATEDPAGFLVHSPYRVIELEGFHR